MLILDIIFQSDCISFSMRHAFFCEFTAGNSTRPDFLFFVKWNANAKANMFQSEYRELKVLKDTNTICIPDVFGFDENFLILEFIPPSNPDNAFWENFGRKLALMHQQTHPKFGLEFDNYIGSLQQSNEQNKNWDDFFIQKRLQAQLSIGDFTSDLNKPNMPLLLAKI